MKIETSDIRQRRALRRAVDIPIQLVTRHVDEPLIYWATDLSPFGMWIETPFPMQLHDSMVVCFKPGVCWSSRALHIFASVERVSRAAGVSGDSGMGLSFDDITAHEQRALSGWLRWRPPPLPKRRCRSRGRRLPQPLVSVMAA